MTMPLILIDSVVRQSSTSAIVQVFGRRHVVAIHAVMWPATEKRQGTKSREMVRLRCSERYGDFAAD